MLEVVNYDENGGSDQENDFDDIPDFVLDAEAEGQDALANSSFNTPSDGLLRE